MGSVVGAVQAVRADAASGVSCMDDLTVAHVNCYMTNRTAGRGIREEYQITGTQAGLGNLGATSVLSSRAARNRLAKVSVYILCKAGAVKGARTSSAVNIRTTQEGLSIGNNAGIGTRGIRCRRSRIGRRSSRSGICAADVAITATVLDLVPAAGGADNTCRLAGRQNTDYTVRSACTGTNIQGTGGIYGLGSWCYRGRIGGSAGGIRRLGSRQILGTNIAVTTAELDLMPVAGGINNGNRLTKGKRTLGSIGCTRAGTNVQACGGAVICLRVGSGSGRRGVGSAVGRSICAGVR